MFLATMVSLEGKVWFYFFCCLLIAYGVFVVWISAYVCLHTTAAKEEEVEEDDQIDGYQPGRW